MYTHKTIHNFIFLTGEELILGVLKTSQFVTLFYRANLRRIKEEFKTFSFEEVFS